MGVSHYWLDNPDAPFATLLSVVGTYCHPEDADAYDDLVTLARERPDDEELGRVKAELRTLLEGNTEGLHPDALFSAASYDDGSDEAFLRRLWSDLYPGEPLPAPR